MINPVWYNLNEIKPKQSGFYLFRSINGDYVAIMYYNVQLNLVMNIIGRDLVGLPSKEFDCFWAKMPRLPQSKLINKGYVKIV